MKTSIVRLGDILIAALAADLDDDDALEFQADMLAMVERTDVTGVLIDINVMDVVDSFMARMINQTASMVGVLGAKAVICGMQPAVALTLVEMGRELTGVTTALNVDHGARLLKELFDHPPDSDG